MILRLALKIYTAVSTEELIGRNRRGVGLSRSPTGVSVRSASAHPQRTALLSNRPLGSAEVVHPFHPLRGHRFVVLKVRHVSGVETLSLRHADLGSFAMPREWTDWAPPGGQTSGGSVSLLVDAFGLVALAELIASLAKGHCEVDR
jgi:hypothetical protein